MDIFTFFFFREITVNSVDPDQMSPSVASELGLHCLHMSLKWASHLERVNLIQNI